MKAWFTQSHLNRCCWECVCYLNSEAFIWAAISEAGNSNKMILCSRGNSASEIAAQINASKSSSNRQISTSTVQRRLCESGLHCLIAAKKPLLKDTNKMRHAWAMKHEQWTLDRWKSVLWSDESKFEFLGSNRRVFETWRRWTDDLRMCSSHREAWRWWCHGVGVLCWWHCGLFRIQGTLHQHGYHSILQWYAIPSGLSLVGLSF